MARPGSGHAAAVSTSTLVAAPMVAHAIGMTRPMRSLQAADGKRELAKWFAVAAAAGLVLAFPVATWWLVGDLSTVPASEDPDFSFRPFDVSRAVERAAGWASALLAAVMLLLLAWFTVRRLLDARWWTVLVPLMAAGFITGAGWRVMTAGVIGANIGAGFVVLLGGPLVAALLVWAVARSIYLVRRL
jgi:hypothetical protein